MWTFRRRATPELSPAESLTDSAARAFLNLRPIFFSTDLPICQSTFIPSSRNEIELRLAHFTRPSPASRHFVRDIFLRNVSSCVEVAAYTIAPRLKPNSAHRRNLELPHRLASFHGRSNRAIANRRSRRIFRRSFVALSRRSPHRRSDSRVLSCRR